MDGITTGVNTMQAIKLTKGWKNNMQHTITQEQAQSLAVNYHAYHQASHDKDALGLRVWSRGLKAIQQETGITLVDDESLEFWINQAA